MALVTARIERIRAVRIVATSWPRVVATEWRIEHRSAEWEPGRSGRDVQLIYPHVSEAQFRDGLARLLQGQDYDVDVERYLPGLHLRPDIVARSRHSGEILVIEAKIADHFDGIGQVQRYATKVADSIPVLAASGAVPLDLAEVCRRARVRPWLLDDLVIVGFEPASRRQLELLERAFDSAPDEDRP